MTTHKEIEQHHGKPLIKYTVDNGNGYTFSCLNYGATLTSITMPDKNGNIHNILLGFDQSKDFINDQTYFFGKAIGRVGGRIRDGSYHINGTSYQLPQNEGNNTLHGGKNGFHHQWWNIIETENGVILTKVIDTETDAFPGKMEVSITYKWDHHNKFHIEFKGINLSETATLFNPTTHNYFNLNNDKTDGLQYHELSIQSDQIVELDESNIPTGKLLEVRQTPFDFRNEQNLLNMLDSVKQANFSGYDHPYKVSESHIATLRNSKNGRKVKIHSDRNGLVFYSLNTVQPEILVNDGSQLFPHMGVALEPQTLPDAIHHPTTFGDIILPGKTKKTYHITYHLTVERDN